MDLTPFQQKYSNELIFQPTKDGVGPSKKEVEFCLNYLKKHLTQGPWPEKKITLELRETTNSLVLDDEIRNKAYSIVITNLE